MYGTASEDMDSLTFATPRLIRNLMKPVTQSVPINEYDYDKAGRLTWHLAPSSLTQACSLLICACTGA